MQWLGDRAMKNIVLFGLVLSILFPVTIFGQTIDPGLVASCLPPQTSLRGASPVATFPACPPAAKKSKVGSVLVNPFVQIGYQRNGINLSIPIQADFDPFPLLPDAHLAIGTMDVVLKDFNFWMGTVGVNAILSPKLTVFGSGTGFQPRDFIQVGQIPVSLGPFGGIPELTLTGSKLEYWILQCGASYAIGSGYSVIGGLLWAKTSMEYSNPRRGDVPLPNQTIRQDFLLKNWVPFVGLQISEPEYYRAALIYSPLVTSSGTLVNRTSQPVMTNLSYNLNQPGSMFSFTFEYSLQIPPPSMISLWFNGTTQFIRGSSDLEFEAPGIFITRNVSTLTLHQYSLAGGITLGLVF